MCENLNRNLDLLLCFYIHQNCLNCVFFSLKGFRIKVSISVVLLSLPSNFEISSKKIIWIQTEIKTRMEIEENMKQTKSKMKIEEIKIKSKEITLVIKIKATCIKPVHKKKIRQKERFETTCKFRQIRLEMLNAANIK